MKPLYIFLLSLNIFIYSCSQHNPAHRPANLPPAGDLKVGGHCEGCEAIFTGETPFELLNDTDTLPGFNEPGPKLEISGTIYQHDGSTPAKDIVLYIYHTDQQGLYPKNNETGRQQKEPASQHGTIRGWIKTGASGFYRFYTLVPASYPNSNNPRHIHPIIKEPGKSAYWIDEFIFDDDPLLPKKEKERKNPVGGNGVLKTEKKDGIRRAKRDIILGLHVEGYPAG